MSALAKLMLSRGKKVTCSDVSYSKYLEELGEKGVHVYLGSDVEVVLSGDLTRKLVVYNAAIPETDAELAAAQNALIPCIPRAHFLSEVARDYKYTACVSGTHGKTTATGMAAYIFKAAGAEFTAHIGGSVVGIGNLYTGGSLLFLTEACEYKRSFLALSPDYAVILNAEEDHPDTYKEQDEVYAAFDEFVQKVPIRANVIVNSDTEYGKRVVGATRFAIRDETAGFVATELKEYRNGYYSFNITEQGNYACEVKLKVPCFHNIYNALAAYALCRRSGVSVENCVKGLDAFPGVERRFERKGTAGQAEVYIDYAHHPTEIEATIRSAMQLKPKKLIVVFQPHTFSRTKALFDEFVCAFSEPDSVFIFKEYAARETPVDGLSARDLYESLSSLRSKVNYYDNAVNLAARLIAEGKDGGIVLILGAGDIDTLADLL
jgi:UDP-N-acetylmuramate--alanine ligase